MHQVPGRDRDQLAVRDPAGHLGQLALVDVTARPARHQERRGLDLPELSPPGADLGFGELVAQLRHVPVEDQRAAGPADRPPGAWPWRGGFLQDEAADPPRVPGRVQVSGRRAHRVPAERHLLQAQRVQEGGQVHGELLDRVRARPVAVPVPAQVGCVHPPRRRQRRRDRRPVRRLLAECVQQHHRRRRRGPPGPVAELNRAGLHARYQPGRDASHLTDGTFTIRPAASDSAHGSEGWPARDVSGCCGR
jgi:hypothetical protein